MKIPHDNGNTEDQHMHVQYKNTHNCNINSINSNIENFHHQSDRNNQKCSNTNNSEINSIDGKYRTLSHKIEDLNNETVLSRTYLEVCNKQYMVNSENNINLVKSCGDTKTTNVGGVTQTFFSSTENTNCDVSPNTTPIDEQRSFNHSETDEMFEHVSPPVPRGIVNPNYPGFQHLAHTLQDYSSNIENFYHSENDMTDDDVDIDISESICDPEPIESKILANCVNAYNNNNCSPEPLKKVKHSQSDLTQTNILNNPEENNLPDLLKIVSNNNNIEFDLACLDTDIEERFHTKDIIGNFNKEVEDEIKQLLNYNINIQDDLQELRKDIKNNFAKPIENTINNISDVVNHVIMKLVETHSEIYDHNIIKTTENLINANTSNDSTSVSNIQVKEDTLTREIEMNEIMVSRPKFLVIDNNKITDAFLSDGKEEISIYENDYDTELLSNNVENTIRQLSTELRKIIPKLDEMRERDRLWIDASKADQKVLTDGNLNEVASSSQNYESEIKKSFAHENPAVRKTINETKMQETEKSEVKNPRLLQNEERKSVRKHDSPEGSDLGSFDVYNIETALPKLDFDAIESHLKAAKEAERRKRNDREEIRKRLAMGADTEEYYSMGHFDRPGRKPSLQSRLQSGRNLQICVMNEMALDNESQTSNEASVLSNSKSSSQNNIFSMSSYSIKNHPYLTRPLSVSINKNDKIGNTYSGAKLRPSAFSIKSSKSKSSHSLGHIEIKESDFFALQATLQTEARIALAQAKELAHIQMERERRSRPASPVTEMLRRSMQKASAPLALDRRRVSRQLLTDINIAQLQVIVNELHSQIESLNESLVTLLMARDELHMGQDSMLVDIEDLTRYLGVKEQTKKTKGKSGVRRLTSIVK